MASADRMLGFHAINARDSSLFHWMFVKHAKSDPDAFRRAMQGEAKHVRDLMHSQGLNYDSLKSALIPSANGVQAVFFYDWLDDPSWNYAVAFAEKYLPHLRDQLRTAVKHGDILGDAPISSLDRLLRRARTSDIQWATQYAVYFSNLRPDDVETLHSALAPDPRYSGYIDVTFASDVRNYLARTLADQWLVYDKTMIMNHGGDDPLVGTEDPVGYDLPDKGYRVVSLTDTYHAGFFTYKIEADDAKQSADDRVLTLAAVTGELIDVDNVVVTVHPDKVEKYLLIDPNKLRLMTSIGLQDVTPKDLENTIRDRLSRNYIYDLRFAQDGTPLFAVSAEFEKPAGGLTKRLLALKHDRETGQIALVTMY